MHGSYLRRSYLRQQVERLIWPKRKDPRSGERSYRLIWPKRKGPRSGERSYHLIRERKGSKSQAGRLCHSYPEADDGADQHGNRYGDRQCDSDRHAMATSGLSRQINRRRRGSGIHIVPTRGQWRCVCT